MSASAWERFGRWFIRALLAVPFLWWLGTNAWRWFGWYDWHLAWLNTWWIGGVAIALVPVVQRLPMAYRRQARGTCGLLLAGIVIAMPAWWWCGVAGAAGAVALVLIIGSRAIIHWPDDEAAPLRIVAAVAMALSPLFIVAGLVGLGLFLMGGWSGSS